MHSEKRRGQSRAQTASEKREHKERSQRGGWRRRGQRPRRNMQQVVKPSAERVWGRNSFRHHPSLREDAVGGNWKVPVGFGTKKVTGAPGSTRSGRSRHEGQVGRAGQGQRAAWPAEHRNQPGGEEGKGPGQGFVLFSRCGDLI